MIHRVLKAALRVYNAKGPTDTRRVANVVAATLHETVNWITANPDEGGLPYPDDAQPGEPDAFEDSKYAPGYNWLTDVLSELALDIQDASTGQSIVDPDGPG